MFTLKMDGDIEELKNYLSRCIRNEKYEINFEFIEGRTNREFNLELVQFYLDKIKELFPHREFNYSIEYQMDTSKVLNNDKCKELEKIDNFFRKKFNKELIISEGYGHGYGFKETLEANRKLDNVANKIKNATNDGDALSPFEKFMLAYEYVTDFVYNEGKDIYHNKTSHWIPVMNGDKIVCAGYASLLKELCDRIFPNQEVKVEKQSLVVYDNNGNYQGGHANNLVCIKDKKYNINGFFYCDPCWDSMDNGIKHYIHCCIPLQDTMHMKYNKFEFKGNITDLYLQQFEDYTKKEDNNLPKNIEEYLSGGRFENELSFIKDDNFTLRKYDMPKLNLDERIQMYKFEDSISQHFEENFEEIIKTYKNLRIPKMEKTKIEELGINKLITKLKSGNFSDKEYIEILENLAKIFSNKEIQDSAKEMDKKIIMSKNFSNEMKKIYIDSKIKNYEENLIKEKEKQIIPLRNQNAKVFLDAVNKKANTNIPIEAFINHLKFIGKEKGLQGEKLKEFVESKIKSENELCEKWFNLKKCSGCLASFQPKTLDHNKKATN